jgi:hypothetical protein
MKNYGRFGATVVVSRVSCEETRDTVARFQRDHQLLLDTTRRPPSPASLAAGGPEAGDQPGAFTVVTRRAILNLVREVELR